MITPAQCRAARAFLNWTLDDLARESGISRTSLNNFEHSGSNAKAETLRAIKEALEREKIEFTDDTGVKLKRELVRILRGLDCHNELMDDIYETLKNTGGEVLIQNVNEQSAAENHSEKLKFHIERLKQANIRERLLACEGDDFFINDPSSYRWISKELFINSTRTYVYADKFAYKIWMEDIIILIQNKNIAEAEKQRFEYIWNQAKPVKA